VKLSLNDGEILSRAVQVEISQAALDAERRQAMPYSISTLLIRNLRDVFGENDPARRRAAIDEIYTADCVFPSHGYRPTDSAGSTSSPLPAGVMNQ